LTLSPVDLPVFRGRVSEACKNVIAAEPQITHFDTIVGDGDCGMTLARGAKAVLSFVNSTQLTSNASLSVLRIANVVEENMDGTSGAIFSIFLAALASALKSMPSTMQKLDTQTWGIAAKAALSQLQLATPARQGDRTLMDALEPFIESIASGETVDVAVSKAKAGVEATKGMNAAFGRAVYVEQSAWSVVPDPGAVGILSLIEGFAGVS
jgi:triose/dihydroxyacetone kinase / FAD-AMP lyase (cyclizing)